MMLEKATEITIVVIVFDTDPALLEQCLTSAKRASRQSDYDIEILVVDNSAHDSLRTLFVDLTDEWIHGQGNIGFARAANLGTMRANGQYILFLNPDAALQSSSIDALRRATDTAPRDSLFCGWLNDNEGTVQVDAYLHWWTSVGRLLRRTAYRRYLNDASAASLVPVQKVSGGALFGDRGSLQRFGPFDERFFLYGEDADLSTRARAQRYSLWAVPAAPISHFAASSQRNYSNLVERARIDATIRISRYHLPFLSSIAVQIDLALVTGLAILLGRKGSSNSLSARSARFGQILRWGFHRDRPPFHP
jgi:GT2 family glycosyltransferase